MDEERHDKRAHAPDEGLPQGAETPAEPDNVLRYVRRDPATSRGEPLKDPAPSEPREGEAGVEAAQPSASGGRPGGGGPPTGGGGGGGGGPRTPSELVERSSDPGFRQALTKALAAARGNLVTVAIYSFFVNMLVLAIPLYLFQISDRVLTSRSMDTLVMLTLVAIGALAAHVILDMMRRFILMRVATDVETRLGAPVLSAAARASQAGSSKEFQTLSDLQQMRSFLTGPVLLSMLDAPAAPFFLLAVFLIHPLFGAIVGISGMALLLIAWLNQRATALPFSQASAYSARANLQTDAMARNAQALNAMGMIPEGVQMWGRETAESLKAQTIAQDRNVLMTGLSKFLRLCTQIAILGVGAWLALDGGLTGGMLIAASIVASRALAPIEGTIEGWRSFVAARSAYARVRALLQSSPLNYDRLRLPKPEGRLTVDRILYVPPPTKKVILNGISFELMPASRSPS